MNIPPDLVPWIQELKNKEEEMDLPVTLEYSSVKWPMLRVLQDIVQNHLPSDSQGKEIFLGVYLPKAGKFFDPLKQEDLKEIKEHVKNGEKAYLVIADDGTGFEPLSLFYFASTKRGKAVGEHGEGLKVAIKRLVEEGREVFLGSRYGRRWIAKLKTEKMRLNGKEITKIVADLYYPNDSLDLSSFTVFSINEDDLDLLGRISDYILFFSDEKPREFGNVKVYRNKKGIYVKGMKIPNIDFESFRFAYDFDNLKVNRDRNDLQGSDKDIAKIGISRALAKDLDLFFEVYKSYLENYRYNMELEALKSASELLKEKKGVKRKIKESAEKLGKYVLSTSFGVDSFLRSRGYKIIENEVLRKIAENLGIFDAKDAIKAHLYHYLRKYGIDVEKIEKVEVKHKANWNNIPEFLESVKISSIFSIRKGAKVKYEMEVEGKPQIVPIPADAVYRKGNYFSAVINVGEVILVEGKAKEQSEETLEVYVQDNDVKEFEERAKNNFWFANLPEIAEIEVDGEKILVGKNGGVYFNGNKVYPEYKTILAWNFSKDRGNIDFGRLVPKLPLPFIEEYLRRVIGSPKAEDVCDLKFESEEEKEKFRKAWKNTFGSAVISISPEADFKAKHNGYETVKVPEKLIYSLFEAGIPTSFKLWSEVSKVPEDNLEKLETTRYAVEKIAEIIWEEFHKDKVENYRIELIDALVYPDGKKTDQSACLIPERVIYFNIHSLTLLPKISILPHIIRSLYHELNHLYTLAPDGSYEMSGKAEGDLAYAMSPFHASPVERVRKKILDEFGGEEKLIETLNKMEKEIEQYFSGGGNE